MKFFVYDNVNGNISLEEESILLIKEFSSLLEESRNKTKEDKTGKKKTRAFKELKYIYLMLDWQSPYFQYTEQDRHNESLKDSGLTEEEFNDEKFKEACRKYQELQDQNINLQLLKSCMTSVRKVMYYFEHVDIEERDPVTGKPIFTTKDLVSNLKNSKDLVASIQELELQVKKGMSAESTIRGNTETGMFD